MIRETGMTWRGIAQKLGRTEAAVSARLTIIRKRSIGTYDAEGFS